MKATRALAALAALTACSQPAPQSAAGAAAAREIAAVQPMKKACNPVITGFDAKGTTLDIFVDAEQLSQMDEPVEDKMKAEALRRWRAAWTANYPGKHATLRVRLRNYFGETEFSESAKV